MKLTIAWLYPDLMSVYGDRGNVIALTKRCEWRGIRVIIKPISFDTSVKELESCDFLFMGGAQDRQQKIVAGDLRKRSHVFSNMVERGVPGLYICGAFQFLGNYYKEADGCMIEGLGVFDIHTINPGFNVKRLIGDTAVKCDEKFLYNSEFSRYLVGFENHGGRTYLGKGVSPMGVAVKGFGNNGEDGTEGVVYKNSFGTYLHGPILPKNPHFADQLIAKALEVKYKEKVKLELLDDELEKKAHMLIAKRLKIAI